MACQSGESWSYITMRCEPLVSPYAHTTVAAMGDTPPAPVKDKKKLYIYAGIGAATLVLVLVLYFIIAKK
jgi:hypothetical protein